MGRDRRSGTTEATLGPPALDATVTYNFHRLASFRRGVCPHCAGTVERTVDVCETHERENGPFPTCDRWHLSEVLAVCIRCKASVRDPVIVAALVHPAVTAFSTTTGSRSSSNPGTRSPRPDAS